MLQSQFNLALRNNIKSIRLQHGLTIKEFAERIGAHPSTCQRWESGTRVPSPYFLRKICKTFKVSANYMLVLLPEVKTWQKNLV